MSLSASLGSDLLASPGYRNPYLNQCHLQLNDTAQTPAKDNQDSIGFR